MKLKQIWSDLKMSPLVPMLTSLTVWELLRHVRSLVLSLLALSASLLILPLAFMLDILVIIFVGFVEIKKILLRSL